MKVTLIGSGNVATHIALQLKEAGVEIACIYNRTYSHAEQLASKVGCFCTNDKSQIPASDVYICSVKDDFIAEVLEGVEIKNKLVIHTAGSVSIDVLSPFSANTGVMWPMQTFSISKKVDWRKIPVYIEANTRENETKLLQFANTLTPKVTAVTAHQRKILHLTSVFACNFTNQIYATAYRLLKENGLDFSTLFPLIDETVSKIKLIEPAKAQTGPAVRNDEKVMNMQRRLLSGCDLEIYKTISKAIQLEHEQLQRETSQD